jgi:hypothetical protein
MKATYSLLARSNNNNLLFRVFSNQNTIIPRYEYAMLFNINITNNIFNLTPFDLILLIN